MLRKLFKRTKRTNINQILISLFLLKLNIYEITLFKIIISNNYEINRHEYFI